MAKGQNIKEPILRWLAVGENAKIKVSDAFTKFKKETKMDVRDKAFNDYYKAFNGGKMKAKPIVSGITAKRSAVEISVDEIEINVFNTDDKKRKDKPHKDMFVPYKTNTPIDIIFSDAGGIMKGTTAIVDGPPGAGKSTVVYAMQNKLRLHYPKAKMICVQSEMKRVDLDYERLSKEWMKNVDFVLLSDPNNIPNKDPEREIYDYIAPLLKKIFTSGYDIIFVDSFENIVDKLVEFGGMTRRQAEIFLLGLFDAANEGIDNNGVNTAVIAINQVTKGGVFAGSNKIKHSITAMMHLHFDDRGERYADFDKNRRNGAMVNKRMYFSLDGKHEVVWDQAAFDEQQERTKLLKHEKENMKETSEKFHSFFLRPDGDDDETTNVVEKGKTKKAGKKIVEDEESEDEDEN